MTDSVNTHPERVDAWLESAARGLGPEELLELFEQALQGLWDRAYGTLSEITLMAIFDRVIHTSAERFPFVSSVQVDETGVSFAKLKLQGHERQELSEAFRFMIIELLAITGSLTGQIITPSLHSQLSRTTLKKRATK